MYFPILILQCLQKEGLTHSIFSFSIFIFIIIISNMFLIVVYFILSIIIIYKKMSLFGIYLIKFILLIPIVVYWLVNTSSSNNKTNHDMWGKKSYIYKKEYLQESDC